MAIDCVSNSGEANKEMKAKSKKRKRKKTEEKRKGDETKTKGDQDKQPAQASDIGTSIEPDDGSIRVRPNSSSPQAQK